MNSTYYMIKKEEQYYDSQVQEWFDRIECATIFPNAPDASRVSKPLKGADIIPIVLAEVVQF